MIVVVGHGRSPEKRGWGEKIDRHTVVRMWDWQWQAPVDYGQRYDHGLFVLTPKGLRTFLHFRTQWPSKSWLGYKGKPVPFDNTFVIIDDSVPVEVVDIGRWRQMSCELGGAGLDSSKPLSLTRGTAAACWAIEKAGSGGCVVLVGFDNVRAGINRPIPESFCPEYWNLYMSRFAPQMAKVYPIGGSKTATHDMATELPLMHKLADSNKVKLTFAEDLWG